METLVETDFSQGQLPDGWMEELRGFRFENRGLRTGGAAMFRVPIPGESWQILRLEVEVEPRDGALIEVGDGMVTLTVDLKRRRQFIAIHSRTVLTEAELIVDAGAEVHVVAFEFAPRRLGLSVDGHPGIAAVPPFETASEGLLEVGFWSDCQVRRIRLLGDKPGPQMVRGRKKDPLQLEVAVDLTDDLLAAPWTEGMFETFFAELKSWGVSRCQWIDYGRFQEGWWGSAAGPAGKNARQTFKNVGEIFPAAVRAAHAQGIEIHALFKPFDMGLYFTHGLGTQAAREAGKLSRIGGPVYWIANFAAEHRHLAMARKPGVWGSGEPDPFTRIDLVKENTSPADFSVDDLRLLVSEDNITYRPYLGVIQREEVVEEYPRWEHSASGGHPDGTRFPARVFRLSGLDVKEPFVALAVGHCSESAANSLVNLIHLFTANGEARQVTYGCKARRVDFQPAEGATSVSPAPDFRRDGVEFDVYPGTPTAVYPGFDAMRSRHAFDSGEGFLAVARGKERSPVAVLSPSFPEVRDWWISWLRAALDAGADGLELRVRNHHSPWAWGEFGFEAPVREEFLRRYGIDLWATDGFDRCLWRKLRGEGYTEFCREARALTRSYGKKLGLHVSPTEYLEPQIGAAMEIHWDWRRWIADGLADSLTLKEICPGTRAARDVLAAAEVQGIPVFFSPYANHLWSRPGGELVCENWMNLAERFGYDGYQLYETAAVVRGSAQGALEMRQPALRELFRRRFTRC